MDNVEIARTLAEVADILEIQGENTFRIRAYRNAVRTVEVQTVPLGRLVEQGTPLTQLPGIGKEMANHIKEMVTTGTLAYRDELLGHTALRSKNSVASSRVADGHSPGNPDRSRVRKCNGAPRLAGTSYATSDSHVFPQMLVTIDRPSFDHRI